MSKTARRVAICIDPDKMLHPTDADLGLQYAQFAYGIYESAHGKIFNTTCVTSKDSDPTVQPPSMARVLIYPSLDSLEAADCTCHQWTLIRLH